MATTSRTIENAPALAAQVAAVPRPARRYVVVSCVFPPEMASSARMSANIAEELAARGDDVTVLAPFPTRPNGRLFEGYRRKLYETSQAAEGYRIIRCFSTFAPQSRMFPRFLENATFGVTSALALLFARRPDAVYSNSWPIFATALIMAVAKLRGIPVSVSVQDIYPESLVAQNRTGKAGMLFRAVHWIDKRVAGAAKALIVISPRLRDLYRDTRDVSADKLHVVANWGDRKAIQVDEAASAAYRRQQGIPPEAFVAVYGGNLAPASGAPTLLRAFGELKDLPNAFLVIAGGGSQLEECRAFVRENDLRNVIFHTPWLTAENATVLGASDVLLLPTIGEQSLASTPSKLISYFLAARPVLAMVLPQSDTAQVIRDANAGWVLPPEDAGALASALRTIATTPSETLRTMGRNAQCYAHRHLCRESSLPRVLEIVDATIE